MDGAGLGAAAQNRRSEGEDRSAIERSDGDDFGLDCRTFADGMPTHCGQLFERVGFSTIAGTDTFFFDSYDDIPADCWENGIKP